MSMTVSEGEFATVVEGEEVVVEGEVIVVDDEKEGVYVELDESEATTIAFWESEDGSEVSLARLKDWRRAAIPIDNSARLEASEP